MRKQQLTIKETPRPTIPDKPLRSDTKQTEKLTELEAVIEEKKQGGLFDDE